MLGRSRGWVEQEENYKEKGMHGKSRVPGSVTVRRNEGEEEIDIGEEEGSRKKNIHEVICSPIDDRR